MSVIHAARSAYEAMPQGVKRVVGPLVRALPVRVRYGQAFASTKAMLAERAAGRLDEDAIVRRRLAELHRAAMRTRLWPERLRSAGLESGIPTPEALRALPLLTKEEVREAADALLDPSVPVSARKWVTTGGTTAAQLGLWIDRDASAADWAFVTDAWSRVGFQLDEKRAVFRGIAVGGAGGSLTRYEPLRRELYCSVFDMDEAGLATIRRSLRRFSPRFLHGYPSAFEILARSYRLSGEQAPRLEALLCVSEMIYPHQRELFAQVFGCRVFTFYGMAEKGAFAAECEHSAELHVDPLFGVVELVDPGTGATIDEPGVPGEIVVTSLITKAMPLLRYRTGDRAQWAAGACACGRGMRRLATIEGRWGREALVAASGARIPMSAVNVHSTVFDRIGMMRYVQERPGIAELLVVPREGFSETDVGAIEAELAGKLGGKVRIEVRVVPAIERTTSGKHVLLEQRIREA